MFGIEIIEHTYNLLLIFFNLDFSLFINHCSTLLVSTLHYFWKKLKKILNSTVNYANTFVDIGDQQPYIFLFEHYERLNTYPVEQHAKNICLKPELRQNTIFTVLCVWFENGCVDDWTCHFFLQELHVLFFVGFDKALFCWILPWSQELYCVINMAHFSNYGKSIFFLRLGYSVKKQYLLLTKLDDRRTSYGKLRQGVTIVIYSTAQRNMWKNHLTRMHVYLFV